MSARLVLVGLAAKTQARLAPAALARVALTSSLLFAAENGHMRLVLLPLVIVALATLDRRPLLAGVLLGAALVVKPQTVVLVPVALLARARAGRSHPSTCGGGGTFPLVQLHLRERTLAA